MNNTTKKYDVSHSQHRIWMFDQLEYSENSLGKNIYNILLATRINKTINIPILEQALNIFIKNHAIFRTSFELFNDKPLQVVHENLHIPLEHIKLDANNDDEIQAYLKEQSLIDFDLNKLPLVKAQIIELKNNQFIFSVIIHHIIFDGWSSDIMFNEIFSYYIKALGNETPNPIPLKMQFYDYVHWHNEFVESVKNDVVKEKFMSKFKNTSPDINFPFSNQRTDVYDYKGSSIDLSIKKDLFRQIDLICKENDLTINLFLLACFALTIYKYTSQDEVVIGVPLSNRTHPDTKNLVGCFINTLPIKINLSDTDTFEALSLHCKEELSFILENQNFPLDHLIKSLKLEHSLNKNPLYSVLFQYHTWNVGKNIDQELLDIEIIAIHPETSIFDFSLELTEHNDYISGYLQYSTQLINEELAQRFVKSFLDVVYHMSNKFGSDIKHLSVISEEEKNKELYMFNATEYDHNQEKSIIEIISNHENADDTAIIFDKKEYSYKEINHHSNQIAGVLLNEIKIKRNTYVAILINKNANFGVSILSVLKSGCGYIPVDISLPADRIEYILRNSAVSTVITESDFLPMIGGIESIKSVIVLDSDARHQNIATFGKSDISRQPNTSHDFSLITDDTVAYMIYTSGTTGMPKGVEITHKSLSNHIFNEIKEIGLDKNDNMLLLSPFNFDMSVWQFLAPLVVGGRVSIITKDDILEPENFANFIYQNKITIIDFVPNILNILLDYLDKKPEESYTVNSTVSKIMSAGAVLPKRSVEKCFYHFDNIKVINSYGPTETTDRMTHYPIRSYEDISSENTVPIGYVLNNVKVYILDKFNNIVPFTVRGEICVSGLCLSKGYWDNKLLTDEKYVSNPYSDDPEYSKIYKTGDMGYWDSDGILHIEGRNDNQVKIRGHRVELEEVDETIKEIYPSVVNVCTILKTKAEGDEFLVSFYSGDVDIEYSFIKAALPHYMIPRYFIKLDDFPTLNTGKTDRQTLENYPIEKTDTERQHLDEMHTTDTEKIIIDLWYQELGNIVTIDRNSNFFEVGGHSLLAIKIMNHLKTVYRINPPIQFIFQYPILKDLAKNIENYKVDGMSGNKVEQLPIQNGSNLNSVKIAPVQEPEWYLYKLEPDSTFYNIGINIILDGNINTKVFESAISIMIQNNKIFNTIFEEKEGVPYLKYQESPQTIFSIMDKQDVLPDMVDTDMKGQIEKLQDHVFDLQKGPLHLIKLVKYQNNKNLLMLLTHHIVWDETSTIVFMRDLANKYNLLINEQKPKLLSNNIDYFSYSKWYHDSIDNGSFDNNKEYWLEKLKVVPDIIELPLDYARAQHQTFNGDTIYTKIDSDLHMNIKKFCSDNNVTLYNFMLSILNLLIYKLSNRDNFIIGTPIQNRNQMALENVLGLFAGALLINSDFQPSDTFLEMMNKTKDEIVESIDNYYPSNYIIDEINKSSKTHRDQFFNIMFAVQTKKDNLLDQIKFNNINISVGYLGMVENTSRFDLTFAIEQLDDLFVEINYCTDLFDKKTVEKIMTQYIKLVCDVIENSTCQLQDYTALLSDDIDLIKAINSTNTVIADKGLCESFVEIAEKYPTKVAIESNDQSFTYNHLLNATINFSNYIKETTDTKPKDRIGLRFSPSYEYIVSVLAVLFIGCTYVPISTDISEQRIENICSQANIKLIITDNDSVVDIPEIQTVCFDERNNTKISSQPLEYKRHLDSSTYIIFTSGSTGVPKGIEVCDISVLNLFQWTKDQYELNHNDNFLCTTAIMFDVSILEILFPLSIGGKIVLMSDDERKSPATIGRKINEFEISMIQFVPEMLNAFVLSYEQNEFARPDSLKYIISAGSVLTKALANKVIDRFKCKLSNHYGPAEATVDTTYYNVTADHTDTFVPIGKPIDNCEVYILDSEMNLVPANTVGEICISGVNVAKGYVNDVKQTEEKFVIIDILDLGPKRIYKTGDLGKYLDSSEIVFIGRKDNQTKILGNRIELEEVDFNISKIDQILGSVSLVKNDHLITYIELDNRTTSTGSNINYYIFTLSQKTEYINNISQINQKQWPEYFNYSPVLKKYWSDIQTHYSDYQIIIVNDLNEIVVFGNTIPVYLEENQQHPIGWDDAIKNSFINRGKNKFNALVVLAGVVSENHQQQGLSSLIIEGFKKIASSKGFNSILIPVRPVGKVEHFDISTTEYLNLKNNKGETSDYWIRLHEKAGGIVLSVEEKSQLVEAPLDFWSDYGVESIGKEYFYQEDCLSPVVINAKDKTGIYYDPCVWVRHNVSEKRENSLNINAAYINNYLSEFVPSYMIPSKYIFIPSLPTNASGKYDRNALKQMQESNDVINRKIVLPRNNLEKTIKDIWSNVLNTENISIEDSFYDIGGTSLSAAMLIYKVNDALKVNYQLRSFLENSTISKMSLQISSMEMQASDISADIIPIRPYHDSNNDCYEDQVITILNWLGEENYTYMYLDLWNFSYEQDSKDDLLGTKLNAGSDIGNILERVDINYGLKVIELQMTDPLQAIEYINEELKRGNPTSIISHSYECPWDPAYQKFIDKNCSIAIGIDMEKEIIYCTDCFNSMYAIEYHFDDFEKAFTGQFFSFEKRGETKIFGDKHILSIIIDNIKSTSDFFGRMEQFAKDIVNADLEKELDNNVVQYCELYRKIYSLRRRRLQVYHLLQKNIDTSEYNDLLDDFKEICDLWTKIYNITAKAFLAINNKKLLDRISNLLISATAIEKKLYQDILQLTL